MGGVAVGRLQGRKGLMSTHLASPSTISSARARPEAVAISNPNLPRGVVVVVVCVCGGGGGAWRRTQG